MLKAKSVQSAAVFLILSCDPLAQAYADDVVGQVLVARGSVQMTMPAMSPVGLKARDDVFREAILTTSKDSAAQVRFLDDTMLTMGRDSLVEIKDFVPPKDESPVAFAIQLAKGYFRFATGLIAKENPKAFSVGTPYGTIGVRGSAATVMVAADRAIIAVTKCCIDVTAQGKTVGLDVPGFYSEIRPYQPPSTPVRLTNELAAALAEGLSAKAEPASDDLAPGNPNGEGREPVSPPDAEPAKDRQGMRIPGAFPDVVTAVQAAPDAARMTAQQNGGTAGALGNTIQTTPLQTLFIAPRQGVLAAEFDNLAAIRDRLNIDTHPEREVLVAHHPSSPPPTQAMLDSQPPYLTWGYWKARVNAGGQPVQDSDGYMPFVSGVLASIGALPQAGTATYQGGFGLYTTDQVQEGEPNFLNGTFSMQLDFGNRTVTSFSGSGSPQTGTTIDLLSTSAVPFASPDHPTFQIPLQINATTAGNTTSMGTGLANGGLFGPTGETAAGVIHAPSWGPDGYVVHGSFIGERTGQ